MFVVNLSYQAVMTSPLCLVIGICGGVRRITLVDGGSGVKLGEPKIG